MRSARSGRAGARARAPSRTAISGSTSARPALRSCSSVSCATAMPFLLGVRRMTRDCQTDGGDDRGARRRQTPLPRAGRRGSAPVKSITVDGVPGSSPPSSIASAADADLLGHVLERARVGPAGRLALVAATAPTAASTSPPVAGELRHAHADRRPGSPRQPAEAARWVRKHEREGARQQRARDRAARPRSSGTHSKSRSRSAATSAVGLSVVAALQRGRRSHGASRVRVRREAVDGVGRRGRRRPPRSPRRLRRSRRTDAAPRRASGSRASTKRKWPASGRTMVSAPRDPVRDLVRARRAR